MSGCHSHEHVIFLYLERIGQVDYIIAIIVIHCRNLIPISCSLEYRKRLSKVSVILNCIEISINDKWNTGMFYIVQFFLFLLSLFLSCGYAARRCVEITSSFFLRQHFHAYKSIQYMHPRKSHMDWSFDR